MNAKNIIQLLKNYIIKYSKNNYKKFPMKIGKLLVFKIPILELILEVGVYKV